MPNESSEFSVVLHELKNPLLAIERLSSMLLDRGTMSEGAEHKLKLIQSSAKEAFESLEEVDLSSAPVFREEFAREPVDLVALARHVAESFETHAEYKNQEIRFASSANACVVLGDRGRLREAMNNLLSNALKYSPRGETVTVQVKRSGGRVRFSVSDNGPGLHEEEKQRLFEPFQRLGPQPTDDENASGLGLYVVKEIVDRHAGEVEVETAEGEGSTFTLVFPAVPPSFSTGDSAAQTAVPEIAVNS